MIEKRIGVCVLLVAVMICLIGSVPVQAAENEETQNKVLNFTISDSGVLKDQPYSVELPVKLYNIKCENDVYMIIFKNIQSDETETWYFGLYSLSAFAANYDQINKRNGEVENEYYGQTLKSGRQSVEMPDGETVYINSYLWLNNIYPSSSYNISGDLAGTVTLNNMTDINDMYVSVYNVLTTGNDPNYEKYVPEFDDSTASYDGDLGYLQNVVFKLLNVYTTIGDTDVTGGYETYLKFNWNTMTSSGVDLTDPDVNVQFMIKVQGTGKYLTGTEFNTSTHSSGYMTLCPEYSDNNYSLLMAEGVTKSGEDSVYYSLRKQVRAQQPLISRTFDIKSSFYFRPVIYRDGWKYGGWTKVSLLYDETSGWSYDYDVVDGVTPDGTIPKDNLYNDDDGIIPDNSYSGSGSAGAGNTVDEAINNTTVITGGNSGDSSGDLVSNVRSMLSMITEIPGIIGALFSFLPGWCLTLLAVGVGLIMVLIVYKLIRG